MYVSLNSPNYQFTNKKKREQIRFHFGCVYSSVFNDKFLFIFFNCRLKCFLIFFGFACLWFSNETEKQIWILWQTENKLRIFVWLKFSFHFFKNLFHFVCFCFWKKSNNKKCAFFECFANVCRIFLAVQENNENTTLQHNIFLILPLCTCYFNLLV